MCSIHIQPLICLEIRPFFPTKLEPFLTAHPRTPLQLLSFFQKAQLASVFAQKNRPVSPASLRSDYYVSTGQVLVSGLVERLHISQYTLSTGGNFVWCAVWCTQWNAPIMRTKTGCTAQGIYIFFNYYYFFAVWLWHETSIWSEG